MPRPRVLEYEDDVRILRMQENHIINEWTATGLLKIEQDLAILHEGFELPSRQCLKFWLSLPPALRNISRNVSVHDRSSSAACPTRCVCLRRRSASRGDRARLRGPSAAGGGRKNSSLRPLTAPWNVATHSGAVVLGRITDTGIPHRKHAESCEAGTVGACAYRRQTGIHLDGYSCKAGRSRSDHSVGATDPIGFMNSSAFDRIRPHARQSTIIRLALPNRGEAGPVA